MNQNGKRLAIYLLINTVILVPLYFVLPLVGLTYTYIAYLVVGVGIGGWYLIYNKGFVYRGLAPDELSNDLSREERIAMVEKMETRRKSSKWALTVLLPIVVSFLLDALYLFVAPMLEGILC